MATTHQQIIKHVDPILRRKRLILSCFILSLVVGIGYYLRIPKAYKSTCIIMYQQQKINPTKMSPDVEKRTGEMINTVSQQVTSRSSLEEIILKFNLYPGLRQKLPMEDIVEYMRDHSITIETQKKGDIFNVSFQGKDPAAVMNVTNELAAKFIEENLRFREERASETSAYVKDELSMSKEALDKKEAVMRDYKLKFYNEMPQQLPMNMDRLNSLQEQYQDNQKNVQDFENTRLLILEQISIRKDLLAQKTKEILMLKKEGATNLDESYTSLAEARKALEELQLRYTDQHPDIKRLKKIITKMEAKEKGHDASTVNGSNQNIARPEKDTTISEIIAETSDPQLEKIYVQLKEVEFSIKNLKDERSKIVSQIEQYQKWIEAAPIREAEWSALTRDYNELKKHYEDLVAKSLEAESAETLERRQKGSQFKIIDPAHLPERPFEPDFKKIILFATLLGLALGGALCFGLEFLDTSFKSSQDLESYIGLAVTIAIPVIPTEKEMRGNKITSIIWTVAFIGLFIVIGAGVTYLWAQGLIVI